MGDGMGKYIAHPLNAVFPDNAPGCFLWEPPAVKLFSDCPLYGVFAGSLCVTLHLCLRFFKLFLCLFPFVIHIGFLAFRG